MTPLDEWSDHRKGLYLHRTTQNRNTKTDIHAPSGIRTNGPRNQAAKTYALDRATTVIGIWEHREANMSTYDSDWPVTPQLCCALPIV
jgi:hypothetical protein